MASVEVMSATIAHAEEAKHEPITNPEEAKKDDVASPPPPPPPPPSDPKQDDPEAEHNDDVAPEPEALAIALEAKAILADEPHKKVVGASSTKVAPEPIEYKTKENAEVAPKPEPVFQDHEDEKEKQVGEEEKVSPQAKVEGKEE